MEINEIVNQSRVYWNAIDPISTALNTQWSNHGPPRLTGQSTSSNLGRPDQQSWLFGPPKLTGKSIKYNPGALIYLWTKLRAGSLFKFTLGRPDWLVNLYYQIWAAPFSRALIRDDVTIDPTLAAPISEALITGCCAVPIDRSIDIINPGPPLILVILFASTTWNFKFINQVRFVLI